MTPQAPPNDQPIDAFAPPSSGVRDHRSSTTPLERRLGALREDLEAIGRTVDEHVEFHSTRRAEARTILRRALDQLDAADRYAAVAEIPTAGRPTVEVEVPLGPETAPPQVVRLDVTGCAGADRLVVVVDLGMGSPNGPAGDSEISALVAAAKVLAPLVEAELRRKLGEGLGR